MSSSLGVLRTAFLIGLLVSPGLAARAWAANDAGTASLGSPTGCLSNVERLVSDLPTMGKKVEVLRRVERAAGFYQAIARLRPGPEATECGRRLAELTRDLGLVWFLENSEHRIDDLVVALLELHLELFWDRPGSNLVAFRLGEMRVHLAHDDSASADDHPEAWVAAADAFARAAALDRGQSAQVEWNGQKGPLARLSAREEALCLFNATSPFAPPNPGQARAMDAASAYLSASGPGTPSDWRADDEREIKPREALLRLLALPADQQLERLVDIATEPDLTPEVRRVAIEVIARRIGQGPDRAARISTIERVLAAHRPTGDGNGARTDTCLRRRFRLKGWTRARRGADPCNGPHDELQDWIKVIFPWSRNVDLGLGSVGNLHRD